jgi:hypothetical protein
MRPLLRRLTSSGRWIVAVCIGVATFRAGVAEGGGTKLVSLADNQTVADGGAYLPAVPTAKFRSVALLGAASLPPGAIGVGVVCQFTLEPATEFGTASAVAGYGTFIGPEGVGSSEPPFPAPVLGPYMLCKLTCSTTSCGTVSLKALFFK